MKWHSIEMTIGAILTISDDIYLDKFGFHFCRIPDSVLSYYPSETDEYCIIEVTGSLTIHSFYIDNSVTNGIKILSKIDSTELLNLCGNNTFELINGVYKSFCNNKLHSYNDIPIVHSKFNYIWYKHGEIYRDPPLPNMILENN